VRHYYLAAGFGALALAVWWQPRAQHDRLAPGAVWAPIRDKVASEGGTGFFVDRRGHVLTAHHVVAGCKEIDIVGRNGQESATLEASSPDDDLSLLASERSFGEPISFDSGDDIAGGTQVTVFSYASEGAGQSAYSGIVLDDRTPRRLAVALDAKSGAGGSAVIDRGGRAVGVMQSALAGAAALATSATQRPVRLAANSSVAREFLRAQGIDQAADRAQASAPIDGLAASEVKVECRTFGSGS